MPEPVSPHAHPFVPGREVYEVCETCTFDRTHRWHDLPFISHGGLSVPFRHSGDMTTNRDNMHATADGLDFIASQLERHAKALRSSASLLRSIARHPAPQRDDGPIMSAHEREPADET